MKHLSISQLRKVNENNDQTKDDLEAKDEYYRNKSIIDACDDLLHVFFMNKISDEEFEKYMKYIKEKYDR